MPPSNGNAIKYLLPEKHEVWKNRQTEHYLTEKDLGIRLQSGISGTFLDCLYAKEMTQIRLFFAYSAYIICHFIETYLDHV